MRRSVKFVAKLFGKKTFCKSYTSKTAQCVVLQEEGYIYEKFAKRLGDGTKKSSNLENLDPVYAH